MVVGWGNVTTVRLSRDTASVPWGFRLHGGQETQTPLTIQRVFGGSVSDGQLQRGDVVIGIEGCDTTSIYHSQAEEIIRRAGNQLNIIVRREGSQNGVQSPQQSPQQWQVGSPQQYGGTDQWNPHEFVNEPGRSRTGANDEDEDYSKSVRDIKKVFSQNPTQYPSQKNVYRSSSSPGPKKIFRKPPSTGNEMLEPGWVPKNKPSPFSQNRYVPSSMRSPPINRRHPPNEFYQSDPSTGLPHREGGDKPAWAGTLRSGSGPRAWELQEQEGLVVVGSPTQNAGHANSGGAGSPVHNPRVQSVRHGPGSNGPVYSQNDPNNVDSDTARVAHLQYNTPIGLYSKDNAIAALESQTRGKPGEGTMAITGVGGAKPPVNQPAQSDVQRMILEEESARRGGGAGRSASQPTSGRQRQAPPPQDEGEEPRSARFHQLVNENSDQVAEYMNTPSHGTASYQRGYAEVGGISDF